MVKLSFQSSFIAILLALKYTNKFGVFFFFFLPVNDAWAVSSSLVLTAAGYRKRDRLRIGNEDLENLLNYAEHHLCFT